MVRLSEHGAKAVAKGVLTAEERRKPGEKTRREQRSAWFKNISRFAAPARTTSRKSRCGYPVTRDIQTLSPRIRQQVEPFLQPDTLAERTGAELQKRLNLLPLLGAFGRMTSHEHLYLQQRGKPTHVSIP